MTSGVACVLFTDLVGSTDLLPRRGGPGDATQARDLVGAALGPSVEFGWPGLERRARRLMAEAGP